MSPYWINVYQVMGGKTRFGAPWSSRETADKMVGYEAMGFGRENLAYRFVLRMKPEVEGRP